MRLRHRIFNALIAACGLAAVSLAHPASAGTTGAIDGAVHDVAGHPLGDVQVAAAAPSYTTKTVTGANGFYALNGLPLDTYALTFTKQGYQTATIPGVTISQDQTRRIDMVMQAGLHTLATVTVRSSTSLVQPTVTSSSYVVNQTILDNINGTPQSLNGFQALNSLPGVTTDNFGYPVIRAGAENDVGYEYDGVDNTDAVTGQFLNAVSLNGARSVQLSTGGYDVSAGNTNSGVINEVIKRGAYPGAGQVTMLVGTPAYQHDLTVDYGSATPDNRFSYYFSFGGQNDATTYGASNTAIFPLQLAQQDFATVNDFVANVFYRWGNDNRNEIQALTNITGSTLSFGYLVYGPNAPYATLNGNVVGNSDPAGLGIPLAPYITLYPGQVAVNQFIGVPDTQTFNTYIDKIEYKRQFSSSSFGDVRFYKTYENLVSAYPYDTGSFTDFNENLTSVARGIGFDYDNQLSSKHELSAGIDAALVTSLFWSNYPSFEITSQPLEAEGCPQLIAAAGFTATSPPGPGYGGCYIGPLNAQLNAAYGTTLPTSGPLAPMNTLANDFSYTNAPIHRYDAYAKDRWQPNDRWTVVFGVRYDQQFYGFSGDLAAANTGYYIDDSITGGCGASNPAVICPLVTLPGQPLGKDVTQPSQLSPRIAATYQLGVHDVLRASYGLNIQFVPESAVQDVYNVDPSLKNCTIASTCFQPLPGYSASCAGGVDPMHANAPCNGISNLYQQVLTDLVTNNFAQYTPVKPERATNVDASWEHDFGKGLDLRITPYYRKGTDYVVSSAPLLFTLTSGTPVFGPGRSQNGGANVNTGVEFELQKQARFGFSGFFDLTYDNTLANYDSDFFPTVNAAALAANHFFHVTYVAPVTATLNLVYNSRQGLHIAANMPYESGYPYGVGTKTFVFASCSTVPGCTGNPNDQVPTQVLNTDLVSTPSQAYYFTDPINPGTMMNPNITGSRGTAEGSDPGTLHGPPIMLVNLSIAQDVGHGPNSFEVGFRIGNLTGNYTPTRIPANLYYVNNGLGGYDASSGVNTNACPPGVINAPGCEPFQYNYSAHPYENESSGPTRQYTFFVSAKY